MWVHIMLKSLLCGHKFHWNGIRKCFRLSKKPTKEEIISSLDLPCFFYPPLNVLVGGQQDQFSLFCFKYGSQPGANEKMRGNRHKQHCTHYCCYFHQWLALLMAYWWCIKHLLLSEDVIIYFSRLTFFSWRGSRFSLFLFQLMVAIGLSWQVILRLPGHVGGFKDIGIFVNERHQHMFGS